MDVSNFYAEAMMENKLKEFVEEAPKPVRDKLVKVEGTDDEWREMTDEDDEETCEWRYKRGSDQSFGQRSCFHKLARIVYKLTRCLYVGVVFYFVPYATLFMQFGFSQSHAEKAALGGGLHGGHGGHGGHH